MRLDRTPSARAIARQVYGCCETCGLPQDTDHRLRILGPIPSFTARRAIVEAEQMLAMQHELALREKQWLSFGKFADPYYFPTSMLIHEIDVSGARIAHYTSVLGGDA